jgi:hypothetical protein
MKGLFLASDEARYVTGVTFPSDAGFTLKQGTHNEAPSHKRGCRDGKCLV